MTARIYKPAKTAMQSGRNKTDNWILEFFKVQLLQGSSWVGVQVKTPKNK